MGNAYRLAAQRKLGAAVERHESPTPIRPIAVIFAIFGLPGIALASGFQSAPGEVFAGDRMTNGTIGATLIAFAAVVAVMAVRKATLRVTVHDNGLRWVEKGKTRDVFWEDIVSITGSHRRGGVTNESAHVYRLVLHDGQELVMTNLLSEVLALAERVERELVAHLLPRATDDLAAGRPVQFGPLTVTKDSVRLGDRTLPLPSRIVIEDGTISIGEGAARLDVEWKKVPNAWVLLALLEPTSTN